ncbi:MAG: DUF928 domain-containing protein [Cyanobacteria bacterium P01_D01_bin.1]
MKNRYFYSVASVVSVCLFSLLAEHGVIAQTSSSAPSAASSSNALSSEAASVPVGFVPPSGDRAPQYTRAGGTRSSCDATSILPESGIGLTSLARPMLQAYFKPGVEQVWLAIEAVDGSEHYTFAEDDYLDIPTEGGLVEIPLPKTLVELTPDKSYTWSMVLLCGDPLGPNTPIINGGVERVSTVPAAFENQTLSLVERAAAYGEFGLWYDLISTLTLIRQEQPESFSAEQHWENVLRSVGLESVFDEVQS